MTTFDQPEMREVRLPQGTVRYREHGSGQPVLFVHGLLVNGLLWRKVVPALATDFRCIVPDWPLGSHTVPMDRDADLSPPGVARLIADYMAALDLEDVVLVGNDTGGALSQLVVVEHPERIGRLVLTNCDAYEHFPPPFFRYLQWAARVPGGLTALLQPMRLSTLHRTPIAFGLLTKERLDPAVSKQYMGPVLRNRDVRRDTIKFLKAAHPRYTLAAAERFGGFARPALVAWAPEDRLFPLADGERLARDFPNGRLELIREARTFIPEDQPEQLAELIAALAREPSPVG